MELKIGDLVKLKPKFYDLYNNKIKFQVPCKKEAIGCVIRFEEITHDAIVAWNCDLINGTQKVGVDAGNPRRIAKYDCDSLKYIRHKSQIYEGDDAFMLAPEYDYLPYDFANVVLKIGARTGVMASGNRERIICSANDFDIWCTEEAIVKCSDFDENAPGLDIDNNDLLNRVYNALGSK